MQEKSRDAVRPPPETIFYGRQQIVFGKFLLDLPGIYEIIVGLALLLDEYNPSSASQWLERGGLSVPLLSGGMIVFGILFIVYQHSWRNHNGRDIWVSSFLQIPFLGRLLVSPYYNLIANSFTWFITAITVGIWVVVMSASAYAGMNDNKRFTRFD